MYKQEGNSLLELLLVTSILATGYCLTMPTLQRLLYLQQATQTMNQLQTILNYARSLAILEQSTIKICLAQDGLQLLSSKTKLHFFKLKVATTCSLTLTQSGFNNQTVEIQANGMAYSNGHFNFKSHKGNSLLQFNLYFNKAFRIYVLREG